jgi:phage terminase small subunit
MALTEQKRRYADARLSGLSKKESAIAAGCPEKTASQAASRLEKDPEVQSAMGRSVAVQARKIQHEPAVDPDPFIPGQADDPLVFLREMMNSLEADPKLRLDAAKAMLPYTHGKVADAGKKETKQAAAKEAAKGKFQASQAPGHLRAVK